MIPLVLGVNFNEVVAIVVLVISVLSWIINVIQGKTPDGTPRPQKPKTPQTGRSEIEELLQELTSDQRKPKPEQRKESSPPPKPPASRSRSKPKAAPQRPGGPPPYTSSRQNAPLIEPKKPKNATPSLGESVRSQHMSNRVEAAVEHDINATVQHDLGNRIAPASATREATVHPLIQSLRDPNGVRQAIMLNEILQRPLALRRASK